MANFNFNNFLSICLLLFSCNAAPETQSITRESLLHSTESLAKTWYPRTIDSLHGGFYSDFNYQWEKEDHQIKMIVSQSRHVWTTSVLARHLGNDFYQSVAKHGFAFLKEKMWDKTNGGFNQYAKKMDGEYITNSDDKTAYGNSFAIYALAAYFQVSNDSSALSLAKETFYWLDKNSRDPEFGGYFNILKSDGSWAFLNSNQESSSAIESPWKDMNTSIHLLESYSELYKVWPNELLKTRLEELLTLVSKKIFTEKGYQTLYLERDWTPISYRDSTKDVRDKSIWYDHVSFGHDVEAAFLMLEAAHILELDNTEILAQAKTIVDHALDHGWDSQHGGFYDYGYYFEKDECKIIRDDKVWWTQAEGLNSLLLMAKLFPEDTRYMKYFQKQWSYINKYFVDHKNGGWYEEGLDSNPNAKSARKAQMWKVNYHNIRALINCENSLNEDSALINHVIRRENK
ncbi:MAG: AGE family epimerase/isomerase [Reichenbachiella sp.]